MGEVYRAHDVRRRRDVALKLLPEIFSNDEEYKRRFRRESHVAARLREPHVIPIHDFGEIENRLYIDMRLVDGTEIGRILEESGPLKPARAVNLIGQIAEALDAAHADGLVHRDVKPSNVLVTARDFVYWVDFGIARSVGTAGTALTATGATVGTLELPRLCPAAAGPHGVLRLVRRQAHGLTARTEGPAGTSPPGLRAVPPAAPQRHPSRRGHVSGSASWERRCW